MVTNFAELYVVHAWEAITDNMIRVLGSELSGDEVASNRERERRERQSRLDVLNRRMRKHFGDETHHYLAPRFHLRKGAPRDVVPAVTNELKADLVVMGTVSRTGIPGLLIGNTAEVILNNFECSVLAVKPAGFVTPVMLNSPVGGLCFVQPAEGSERISSMVSRRSRQTFSAPITR